MKLLELCEKWRNEVKRSLIYIFAFRTSRFMTT